MYKFNSLGSVILLTVYWLGLSPMTTPRCKGYWEIESLASQLFPSLYHHKRKEAQLVDSSMTFYIIIYFNYYSELIFYRKDNQGSEATYPRLYGL